MVMKTQKNKYRVVSFELNKGEGSNRQEAARKRFLDLLFERAGISTSTNNQ